MKDCLCNKVLPCAPECICPCHKSAPLSQTEGVINDYKNRPQTERVCPKCSSVHKDGSSLDGFDCGCPCHTQRSKVGNTDFSQRSDWEIQFDKELGQFPYMVDRDGAKRFFRKVLTQERENMRREVLAILVDEIATAHKEGTPTARLTSAYNRLKN